MAKNKLPAGLTMEQAREVAESQEMKNLYHALAIAHSNALFRVLGGGGKSVKRIKELAVEEAKRVIKKEISVDKCPPGHIYDHSIDKCVPIFTRND